MTLAVVQHAPSPRRTASAPTYHAKLPPKPFTLAHFRAWAADLILDTGESWHPEPFQDAFLEDVFSGFRECWLVVPEENGKTTLVAGLALYHCEHRPMANVPVAASSRDQAEIIYGQAEGFVLRSPRMYEPVHSAIQQAKGKQKTAVPRFSPLSGYRRINHFGGGRIQVMAADERTGDGGIPTLALVDEMHRHRDLSLYRTWAGKLGKRDGQIVGISTAGELGSDFEETRRRILETAEDVETRGSFTRAASDRLVLHQWALPETDDPEDIAAVKSANPFSGITVKSLTQKRHSPTMNVHHWLRFVCCRPTQDVDSWLGGNGPVIWEGLTDPYELVPGARTWVGVDIARTRDTSAVVAMQKRPDGRYHAVCRIWIPMPNRPNDETDVMKHLRELDAMYNVEAIGFDPRFFDVPAKMLGDEGLVMAEIPQSLERMTVAYGSLYEAILGGKLTHDEDRLFTMQVLNGVPRFSERGFIISKDKSSGKVDAAAALAMAYDQVLRHETEAPSVYTDRGLLAV